MNRLMIVFGFVYKTALFVTFGCSDASGSNPQDTAVLLDASSFNDATQLDVGLDTEVNIDPSNDASLLDVGLDTEVNIDLSGTICALDAYYCQYMAEGTCSIPLTQPAESSDIYQSIQIRDGGFVSSYELCDTNPYAWYPNKPTNPTAMVACGDACLLMISLFPSYVLSTQESFGCDATADTNASLSNADRDGGTPKHPSTDFICSRPKDQFQNISEISCEVPITQPIESNPIYNPLFNDPIINPHLDSSDVRAPEVVSSRDQCDANPYAWYSDDPTNPTRVFACESLSEVWKSLYPYFIASMRPFFGCDTTFDDS